MTRGNPGDVAYGCRIVFHPLAAVKDLNLTDISSGQYLRIHKTIAPGEEIHVHTGFSEKRHSLKYVTIEVFFTYS